jgi:hypothetical protein
MDVLTGSSAISGSLDLPHSDDCLPATALARILNELPFPMWVMLAGCCTLRAFAIDSFF